MAQLFKLVDPAVGAIANITSSLFVPTGVADVVAVVAKKQKIQSSESQQKAKLHGELGWNVYQKGDYSQCLEYSQKALALDSTQMQAANGIALVYLVSGKSEATDAYVEAIELMKRSNTPKLYLEKAIQEIDKVKEKFPDLKTIAIIRDLLTMEYKK